jgi:hypothetical protein
LAPSVSGSTLQGKKAFDFIDKLVLAIRIRFDARRSINASEKYLISNQKIGPPRLLAHF